MTFVVEDGTGKDDANSYLSVAESKTVATEVGYDNYEEQFNTSALQEEQLMWVARWLDRNFRFYGQSYVTDQALQWPRTKNYDKFGKILAAGTIPDQLKRAAMLLIQLRNGEEGDETSRAEDYFLKSFSVGPISETIESFLPGDQGKVIEVQLELKSIGMFLDHSAAPPSKTYVE